MDLLWAGNSDIVSETHEFSIIEGVSVLRPAHILVISQEAEELMSWLLCYLD